MASHADAVLQNRSILVVDDHTAQRTLLVSFLGGLGCSCDSASGGTEALQKMRARSYELVVLDLRMDDLDGLEVLKRAHAEGLGRNFVMMSAEGTIAHAVEAIRLGASDFLVKPFELAQLKAVVRRVLGTSGAGDAGDRDHRLAWRDEFAPQLMGTHESLLEIFLVLQRIANTDCTVLVLGESGTGKELVARAVHNASNRRNKPFVPVNCGAIAETLIESELFGHAKGAFSGATSSREGRFAAADGGTLFLDEIGEMSLPVQVKFLRVLQEGEYVPVGETRPRKCDVRIIAATNRHLEEMAEQGGFREDLFYRLNLIPIRLPALRERRDDIPILARYFLSAFNDARGRHIVGFSNESLALLTAYGWPGNVRELENTVQRMSLLHEGDGVLDVNDLPPKLQALGRASAPERFNAESSSVVPLESIPNEVHSGPSEPVAPTPIVTETPSGPPIWAQPGDFVLPEVGLDLRAAVDEFEMSLIDQALERTGGNRNQASILLGMNRTTLVEKLRKRSRRAKTDDRPDDDPANDG